MDLQIHDNSYVLRRAKTVLQAEGSKVEAWESFTDSIQSICKILRNYFGHELTDAEILAGIECGEPEISRVFDTLCQTYYRSYYRPQGHIDQIHFKFGNVAREFHPQVYTSLTRKQLEQLIGQTSDLRHRDILIKPNFVSPSRYPESCDLKFLATVIKAVRNLGGRRIIVADGPSLFFDSRPVFKREELLALQRRYDIELIDIHQLDDDDFVRVRIPDALILKDVYLPRFLKDVEFLINLCVLKAHNFAGYTGAIKNFMGMLPPFEKLHLHRLSIQEFHQALVDLRLILRSDLVIMDARQVLLGAQQIRYGGYSSEGFGILVSTDNQQADQFALQHIGWSERVRDYASIQR